VSPINVIPSRVAITVPIVAIVVFILIAEINIPSAFETVPTSGTTGAIVDDEHVPPR